MLTIRNAEAERLAAIRRRLQGKELMDAVRQIQARVASRPILDHRKADEIVGYNEDGTFD